jgi:hypothetical protein
VKIEQTQVLSQNITLVYDTLDPSLVDTGKLKALLGDQTKPAIMDTPQMVVAIFPKIFTFVQIGEKRIRVTVQQQTQDIGTVPIWAVAAQAHQLVPSSKSKLIAYGLNFDIAIVVSEGNILDTINNTFLANPSLIADAIQGHFTLIIPRLKFSRDRAAYELVLEPIDGTHLKVHLNAHYAHADINLPPSDSLERIFRSEFSYLIDLLGRFLQGGHV